MAHSQRSGQERLACYHPRFHALCRPGGHCRVSRCDHLVRLALQTIAENASKTISWAAGNAPWWAIAFSIVSAETSTLTVIGTPALSFRGNFGFLQVVLGYLLARIVISVLFLPQYFRGEMFTAYELMQRRFGPQHPQIHRRDISGAARTGGRRSRVRRVDGRFPSFSAPAKSPPSSSSSA